MPDSVQWYWETSGVAACFVVGTDVFSRSGAHLGRCVGNEVFGLDGRYLGEILEDRIVQRDGPHGTVGVMPRKAQPARTPPPNKEATKLLPHGVRALPLVRRPHGQG
ncbi:hypothetical protein [Actinoplanes sp. NPDC049681]|uniref:hypothetical protein n=1 Tax=Actinoplanes sp. NPDC049681 TaxID=3363905 RepID=UPI0037A95CD1